MPRFLVTTRRELLGEAPSARAVVTSDPSVKIVQIHSADMVTIDATDAAADELKQKVAATHYVEPEIRRDLL